MRITERAVTTVLGAVMFVIAVTLLIVLMGQIGSVFDACLAQRSGVSVLEVIG